MTPPISDSVSQSLTALAEVVSPYVSTEGDHATQLSALTLHRRNAPTEPLHCIYTLALGVVIQGAKQVVLDKHLLDYAPGQSMVTAIDVPVVSHVTQASRQRPFLGLMLGLDSRILASIAASSPPSERKAKPFKAISIEYLDSPLIAALTRLLVLQQEPLLFERIAPLIQEEIAVRLLAGPHGSHLRQLVASGSPPHHVARAIAWLKQNFMRPIHVDELAARSCMSPSNFRHHFRIATGTSPLQYQKQLRLQEARQLMVNQRLDAGKAAGLVGYESPSQFSREYSRLFGAPPQQDARCQRAG